MIPSIISNIIFSGDDSRAYCCAYRFLISPNLLDLLIIVIPPYLKSNEF